MGVYKETGRTTKQTPGNCHPLCYYPVVAQVQQSNFESLPVRQGTGGAGLYCLFHISFGQS